MDGLIASHHGRVFNTAGDSVIADFASAADAVQCAVAVQAALSTENMEQHAAEPMQFRIGVHVSDVVFAFVQVTELGLRAIGSKYAQSSTTLGAKAHL